jgi:hypothetical protein
VNFVSSGSFIRVELRKGLNAVLAVIIRAFVNRDLFPDLPAEEREVAVGAEVF